MRFVSYACSHFCVCGDRPRTSAHPYAMSRAITVAEPFNAKTIENENIETEVDYVGRIESSTRPPLLSISAMRFRRSWSCT